MAVPWLFRAIKIPTQGRKSMKLKSKPTLRQKSSIENLLNASEPVFMEKEEFESRDEAIVLGHFRSTRQSEL